MVVYIKTNVRSIFETCNLILYAKCQTPIARMKRRLSGSSNPDMADKRLQRGQATRKAVLSAAADIASAEGLEGLTIGRLSQQVGLSKSGLFAHFGSKRELQLAVVDFVRETFLEKVVTPSREIHKGLPRLYAMEMNWIDYVQNSGLHGGCFFTAAAAEFDGRPGPIRERIAALTRGWRDMLKAEAQKAIELGHLHNEADPALLAFQLHALPQQANWAYQLLGEQNAFDHARASTQQLLRHLATPEGLRRTKERRTLSARALVR